MVPILNGLNVEEIQIIKQNLSIPRINSFTIYNDSQKRYSAYLFIFSFFLSTRPVYLLILFNCKLVLLIYFNVVQFGLVFSVHLVCLVLLKFLRGHDGLPTGPPAITTNIL